MPRNLPRSALGWLVVAALAAVAGWLVGQAGSSLHAAGGDLPAGGGRNVLAVVGQVAPDAHGVYLVDLENATICVYQLVPSTGRIRLMAARTFVYDVLLDDYNNESPLPEEVKALTKEQKRLPQVVTDRSETTGPEQ